MWKIQEWKLAYLPKEINPKKVLDVGAGIGCVYRKVLEKLGKYVSLDIIDSKEFDYVWNITKGLPQFKDKEFGLVWCSEVLEHISQSKQEFVVDELVRVANKVILFFAMPSPTFHSDPEHREVIVDWSKYNPELVYDKWSILRDNCTRVVVI